MPFHTIAVHWELHWDEIVALVLLRLFGEDTFPGVKTAKLEFWRTLRSPDGRNAKQLMSDGILPVGVGGGPLDEHPTEIEPRQEGHCAATLVADILGLSDRREMRQLLGYTLRSDTQTGLGLFEMASMVKAMHATNPGNPESVIEWASRAVGAYLHDQAEFWKTVDLLSDRIEEISLPEGPANMVVAELDSRHLLRAGLSEEGANAALVVQKSPTTGNVQIFTHKNYRLDLDGVMVVLDWTERKLAGEIGTFLPATEGVKGDRWFYFKPGAMILNGSNTRPDVPPTRIPLREIIEIIRKHIKVKPREERRPSPHRMRR